MVTITDILNDWADLGVFAYVLPFLMIFAVVFGILNKTSLLGRNKGVQATIALVVGLMSLQYDLVSNFFSTIFPYTGIGIAILLIALILIGLMAEDDEGSWVKHIWPGLGIIIFLVVLFTALTDFAWFGGRAYIWNDAWPMIIIGLIALGAVALIVFTAEKRDKPREKHKVITE